jgi:cytochrome c-type biogenesis protein CcmH/NrfF
MAVAGEYRCPVCAGESVASSDAPEAVEIKGLIQRWLGAGRSPGAIRAYLVKDYGASVLERPPASGIDLVVWALPAVAVAAGLIGLGLAFARPRRPGPALARPGTAGTAELGPAPSPVPDLEGGREPARAAKPSRRFTGRPSLVAGTALVVIAAGLWLVDRSATARLPGDTITGGQGGTTAALQQASSLAATDPAAALAVYDEVLASRP